VGSTGTAARTRRRTRRRARTAATVIADARRESTRSRSGSRERTGVLLGRPRGNTRRVLSGTRGGPRGVFECRDI
jgi:hypothetical protein